MRIALLTDLHANREALEACLAHADRIGVERWAFVGDLVGYGADPGWVVDRVRRYVEAGALAVLGNHDQAAVHGPDRDMNPQAAAAITWTQQRLDEHQRAFLAGLPLAREVDGECLLVHANAWAPAGWEYIQTAADARRSLLAVAHRYTCCGHMHVPALYHVSKDGRVGAFEPVAGTSIPLSPQRRWLIVPGAVGQPRDGIPAACYAILQTAPASIVFYRVPYDWDTAAARIRQAGLPDTFARRLLHGTGQS